MVSKFFINLAQRFYKEPALSDMTCALAHTSPYFRKTFMQLFRFDKFNINERCKIRREYPKGGSQPDFYITQGDKVFVIENKINDRDYHFTKYSKAFNGAYLGFISSYKLDSEAKAEADANHFAVARWQHLYDILIRRIRRNKIKDKAEREIISAYCIYLKEVCEIVELRKVRRIDQLTSLHSLLKLLKWTLQNADYENDSLYFEENWAGIYFDAKVNRKIYYPLFGIEFDDSEAMPSINLWIEKEDNEKLYDFLAKANIRSNSIYIISNNEKDEYFEFRMKKFEEIVKQPLEGQQLLLSEFLTSSLKAISKYM